MKEGTKTIAALLLTGGAIYALSKMQDGGSSATKPKASNPAFKYPQGTELNGPQEKEVLAAIFANRGLDFKKMASGGERKISEAEHRQLMNDLKDAMNYYPSAKNIAKIREDFIKYKDNFIGGYHTNAGYHMGQIDGFAGVY